MDLDLVSRSSSKTHAICHQKEQKSSGQAEICSYCGGNGYMKTSPNCYHTCQNCLGRGMSFLKG